MLLVVDDDDDLRSLVCAQLDIIGYDVVEASDGAEALAHLSVADRAPRAILTDLSMPRLDGWRFIAAVRSDGRWSTIPILVISASPQPPIGVRCLRKPVAREHLMQALAEIGVVLPG